MPLRQALVLWHVKKRHEITHPLHSVLEIAQHLVWGRRWSRASWRVSREKAVKMIKDLENMTWERR